jgi:hypothetical protein
MLHAGAEQVQYLLRWNSVQVHSKSSKLWCSLAVTELTRFTRFTELTRPTICTLTQVHVLKGALGLRNDTQNYTLDNQAQLLHTVAQV